MNGCQRVARDDRRTAHGGHGLLRIVALRRVINAIGLLRSVIHSHPGANSAREETHAQRAPRDKANAELLAQREDLCFRTAPQH